MHKIKKHIVLSSMFAGLVALSGNVLAEEEEGPTTFTYATYFYCDVTGQERADEIVKSAEAPAYDKMVAAGKISAWGWMAHHTGGKWRRIQYHQASSLEALLDAQEEIGEMLESSMDDALSKELGKICNAHEDYIWEVEAGSASDKRGEAGFSVYYLCDETKEERADEIFKTDFAPILNKYVAAGKLSSWGWQSHWVGGKYRRLQTMTGANHKALLKARGELIEEMYPEDGAAGKEFTEICGSHADYMWDIQIEKS